jgi:hypothetical protein
LLPWVLGREVNGVRARYVRRDHLGTLIELDLRLTGGLVASCLAGHQIRYIERMEIGLNGRSWIAGPAGLTTQGWLPPRFARGYLETRGLARAVARKLMRQPGDTLETFRRQFQDWARVLRSPGTDRVTRGADGRAGARCVALVEAGRSSLDLEGVWVDVQSLTG